MRIFQALLFCVLLGAVGLTTAGADTPTAQAPNVHITQCGVVDDFVLNQIGFGVTFRNDSPAALRAIVWRAKYGTGWIDFKTVGTFSPGVVIVKGQAFENALGHIDALQPYWPFPRPDNCSVIATESQDGQTWNAVGISPEHVNVPTIPPDSATPIPATFDPVTKDPIGLISCKLNVGQFQNSSATLDVRFRNLSDRTIDGVLFRGIDGPGGLDFKDQTSVEPGAFAKHSLTRKAYLGMTARGRYTPGDAPYVFISLDEPASCAIVSAHYSDGETWQNPSVGQSTPPIPTPSPDSR